MNGSTSSSSAESKTAGRSRNRAPAQPDQATAKRKPSDRASVQPNQLTTATKPATPHKDRATPAVAERDPVARAATGTAETSDGADTHRAQRGAAKRADRGNAKSANASEATQASYAVSSVTAAPAHSAPTQALGRVRTKAPNDAPRSAEHRPARAPSKLAQIEALLRRDGGAAIADLMAATGWQRHSVHGVLSGTFKTKLGLVLTRTQAPGGTSVYAIKSPA